MSDSIDMLVSVTMVAKVRIQHNGVTARIDVEDPTMSPIISFNRMDHLDNETKSDYMKLAVTQLVKNIHENLQVEIKELGEYGAPASTQGKA
jgi:hypothetical protein